MNKADNGPAFMEINGDEGQKVDRVGSQGRLEEGISDQRSDCSEKRSHENIWGKSIPDRETSKCRGPEMPAYSRKEANE